MPGRINFFSINSTECPKLSADVLFYFVVLEKNELGLKEA